MWLGGSSACKLQFLYQQSLFYTFAPLPRGVPSLAVTESAVHFAPSLPLHWVMPTASSDVPVWVFTHTWAVLALS